MKIIAFCGMGLGTSMIVKSNIEKILKDWHVTDIKVEHADVGSVASNADDIFLASRELAEGNAQLGTVVSINNLIDNEEIKSKLRPLLEERGVTITD
jgi:PTS system ascorbate-specific IIB component